MTIVKTLVMKKMIFVFCAVMAMSSNIIAADILHLQNGDRLTGEVLFQSPKTIRFQTNFGVVYVPVDTIKQIETQDKALDDFIVQQNVKEDKPIISGPTTLMRRQLAREADKENAKFLGAEWSGMVNLGGELETGNIDSETIAFDTTLRANWADAHRLTLGFDYIRQEEDDVKVDDDREITATYDFFVRDKWFWNNSLSYEEEPVNLLEHRLEVISGLGYQFFDDDFKTLEITLGLSHEREKFEDEKADESWGSHWTLDYEHRLFTDALRLFHNHDWNAPSDDLSAFLFESETGVRIPLRAGLLATGEVEFDWDNDPTTGQQEDDTTYSLKLGYEW